MKRILAVSLVLVMVLSFVACNKTESDSSSEIASVAQEKNESIAHPKNESSKSQTSEQIKSDSSKEKTADNSSSQENKTDGYSSDFETPSYSYDDNSSYSQTTPPATDNENSDNGNFLIKSIDMLNFYSAKKYLEEKSLLPLSGNKTQKTINLSDKIYYYELNANTKFTISMITYFTVNLNDENGFLAKKLGGTGLVEVVITRNNLEDMITFKREDKFYSCLCNDTSYNQDSTNSLKSIGFTTHKYIQGFDIVKNLEQENFKFTVNFESAKVTAIESARFKDSEWSHQYNVDDITLNEDFCAVLFVKQQFTIAELESYFSEKDTEI